ncbi:MAG TPA: GxxExxY protein [Flavisolibacter sp.]|nr:GxxExxY protein [Flavisolibacter sp.]
MRTSFFVEIPSLSRGKSLGETHYYFEISFMIGLSEDEAARLVVDECFHIHKQYGPGLLESLYERILFYELQEKGLSVQSQVPVPLLHGQVRVEVAFRADLIVENKLLIELKSVEALAPVHQKQVLTYLRLTQLKLGLLINFNSEFMKQGIRRVVNNL